MRFAVRQITEDNRKDYESTKSYSEIVLDPLE